MKPLSCILLISRITLVTAIIHPWFLTCQTRTPLGQEHLNILRKHSVCLRKRPKNKPKPHIDSNDTHEEENHGYQPNPVVLTGVSHIMNGALNIAQDPHSRPNLGHSIAGIVHGIITIIIEKLARKKISIKDWQILEECYNEACHDINNQITYMMKNKI